MVEELVAEQDDPLISRSRRISMMMEKGLGNLKSYPRGVFFVLGNEFCERFSFYGMRALLILYFIHEHHFSESTAKMLFHAFSCLAFLSPLLGSILADSYLGRFKVILYVSIFYVCGHCLLSVGAIPDLSRTFRSAMDYSGLIVIALCTGGIKPCVSAFAADQFDDSQKEERAQFFSFFYFAINAGSLVAMMVTPILKNDISCFGSQYCFPLAFGVPGLLMLLSVLIFLCGQSLYKKLPPSRENIACSVTSCIAIAAARKVCGRRNGKREDVPSDWLQLASPEYSQDLIHAVKTFIEVAIVFGPLVLFWALFDQQGSTWVLQARRMNGRVGPVTVSPEQTAVVNPLLILILVPLFEGVIYPLAKKVFRVTPLRKMAVGGLLASISFLLAGLVQMILIDPTMSIIPMKEEIRVWTLDEGAIGNVTIDKNGRTFPTQGQVIPVGAYSFHSHTIDLSSFGGKGVILRDNTHTSPDILTFDVSKGEGCSVIHLLVPWNNSLRGGRVTVFDSSGNRVAQTPLTSFSTLIIKPRLISDGRFLLKYGKDCEESCLNEVAFHLQVGAVFIAHLENNSLILSRVIEGNTVSVLWMLPQYIVMTIGEVLLSVTGLEFAYSQAAPSMKSVLQALWLVTIFAGNLIDMAISGVDLFPSPAIEFYVYAFIMFAVMAVFIVFATRYTYKDMRMEGKTKEKEMEQLSPHTPL